MNFIQSQMTKNHHLSDASGLLAEKVGHAVALVMLTFTTEIEKITAPQMTYMILQLIKEKVDITSIMYKGSM